MANFECLKFVSTIKMQPYFGIAEADVGEQQHPREAPYVCSCLSFPCSRHPSKFDTTTLLLPHQVFSAWHENHSLSGWENPYWLELFGLLKQYPGHSFQRHLHDFSSCHRRKTIQTLTDFCCHKEFPDEEPCLLAAILLVIFSLQPKDRQNQLLQTHLTMPHFHCSLFFCSFLCCDQCGAWLYFPMMCWCKLCKSTYFPHQCQLRQCVTPALLAMADVTAGKKSETDHILQDPCP